MRPPFKEFDKNSAVIMSQPATARLLKENPGRVSLGGCSQEANPLLEWHRDDYEKAHVPDRFRPIADSIRLFGSPENGRQEGAGKNCRATHRPKRALPDVRSGTAMGRRRAGP